MELNGELNELMKKTFDSIDTDGSGFIDMNELVGLCQTLSHKLSDAELKVVFDELDENKDQKISYPEFVKWWKKGRRGQGNTMKKLIGVQTKAKRFLEGAHAEIAAAAAETVTEDDVSKFSCDIKIGGAIENAPLGVNARLNTGDNSERDEIVSQGGLDENERQIFVRLSLKIGEGKDPENARDRLNTIVTKYVAGLTAEVQDLDLFISKVVSFKYRVRDGFVDVYVMIDPEATLVKRFIEEVWTKLSDFIPQNVVQEISGGLTFAKSLSDVRNCGDSPVFVPLLEGINLSGKL